MAITDLDKYKSFIQEGQTGYESTPGQLGLVDPGIKYDPRHHSYASDLYQYYLGGGMPPGGETGITTQAPGTTDQGITYLTETGEPAAGPGTGITAIGGAQNPLTQMVTDPATGQTMTVKQAMTSNQAYAIPGTMPLTPVSGAWGPQDYLQPTTDQGVTADAGFDDLASRQIGRQNVTGDITDYLDPIDLDVTSLSPGVAAVPAGLTAARVAKDAAGNWLYRGAAPGTKAATQAAAKGATAGQIGKAIWKEGGFGVKGPKGLGTTNVGFDPAYKGAGATGRAGYIGQGLKSLTGAAAAGNIGGGTPAARLAFEKALQSGVGRGIAGAARVAGLTTPIGAAVTAATLTPTVIDALTKRDPDATETSMFGLDLQDLEDRAAAYDAGETATLDDWGAPMGDVPDPTVTGITGPAGMDYADTGIESRIADAGYRDPIMDMVAADQGVTADAGFSDADIQTAQSPESKSLLEKVKSGAATAGDYVTKYGMAAWNFAKGNMMGGALSLVGGAPLAFAGALGAQKTNVTPEDRAANAAFEQKHGISIGDDGRITSGPLQGTIPAGKSFAGSANYDEMIDTKITNIKNRKAPQTDASRAKIAELEAMKTTKAAPTGIMKPGGYDEVPEEAIPTEEEEDITDLMTFEQLGGWLGRDDRAPDEPTPTGIEGPPSIISPEPTEPTGPTMADVAGPAEPTTPTPTVPDHISGATTSTPRGGGADVQDVGRGSPGSMPTGTGGPPSRGGSAGGPPSQGGGGGGSGGCFVKGTPITMADGSTKPVEQVDLGDEIAEGGKVFAAGRFLTEELHDYEGIKVSGSHMVNEDGTWVRVRDSEKGKPLGEDEHTVYVFGAENRRILINGILFTDYFEVKEQDQLATIGDKYFEEWKDHDKFLVNLEEKHNVAVLNS